MKRILDGCVNETLKQISKKLELWVVRLVQICITLHVTA